MVTFMGHSLEKSKPDLRDGLIQIGDLTLSADGCGGWPTGL